MSKSILFVGSTVFDYETLLASVASDVEVYVLNADEDGVLQMAALLAGRTGLDAIHIVSHGSSGSLSLGSSVLDNTNVDSYSAALRKIGSALSDSGDILLYGCAVAKGDVGLNFINQLGILTGANVAASTDATGNAALGGNWVLEAQTGAIKATALQATEYAGLLAGTITNATYSSSTNTLQVTGVGMSTTITPSLLTITGEGGLTYTLTTAGTVTGTATSFSVTLNAADQMNVEGLLNKSGTSSLGGTSYNLAAATGWSGAGSAADLTANAITDSFVPPAIITPSAYNYSTGTLLVTGTDFAAISGTANDITVSKLTITGLGGATYTLTSPNVEASSPTSFTLTLNPTDKAAVNLLLNNNGTASYGTTYNLAAAIGWNGAAATADLTGNGITVSNAAAAVTFTATTASTDTPALSTKVTRKKYPTLIF